MTALILGSTNDPTILHFASYVQKHPPDIPIVFIDCNRIGQDVHMAKHHLYFKDALIPYSHITCVWNRMLCTAMQWPRQTHHCGLHHLNYLLDEVFTFVINRPKHCMHNTAKYAQLLHMPLHYLQRPSSILTNNPQHFIKQYAQQSGLRAWIYKSASNVRSIVHTIDRNTQRVSSRCQQQEPVLFQTCLPGQNIRVHIIGNRYVAKTIVSDRIDYRYDPNATLLATTLPNAIADECIAVCQHFKLYFAGIDLIFYQGDFYILEVNTAPGFDYFDTEHTISHHLLTRLLQSKTMH